MSVRCHIYHRTVHLVLASFENGFSYRFEPQWVQNISSSPISDPHFTQEDELVSFFFLGFLVFVVVFLAVFLVFLAAFLGLEGFFFAISPTSPSSVMVKPSAPAFIPDLLRYCLSYSSSSCWRDFLPVPACTCLGFGAADGFGSGAGSACGFSADPGLGRRGSGLKSLPR